MSDGGVNHKHVNQGNVVCVLFWKLSISQFVLLLFFFNLVFTSNFTCSLDLLFLGRYCGFG